MKQLAIWMNHPAFYQADFFRALVATGKVDLKVYFAKPLTIDRQRLGWESDLEGFHYQILDQKRPIRDALFQAFRDRHRFHIVSGIWAEPAFATVLLLLRLMNTRYAIYAEAPNPYTARSRGKKLLKSSFGKLIGHNPSASLLAVSHLSADYYSRLGFKSERIYPFGYFESGSGLGDSSRNSTINGRTEIIFVGAINERKGVDILVESIVPLLRAEDSLHLTIVGDGEARASLEERIRQNGVDHTVTFAGVLPAAKVRARIAQANFLVLPSRWDGWGIVVNESLSVGVPVIVSDQCGAADIIQHGINGYVFRSEDADDLRLCLADALNRQGEWLAARADILRSGSKLSTEVVAPYLLSCLKHMEGSELQKPVPPWEE